MMKGVYQSKPNDTLPIGKELSPIKVLQVEVNLEHCWT
jgi:hypothetical protein